MGLYFVPKRAMHRVSSVVFSIFAVIHFAFNYKMYESELKHLAKRMKVRK